MSLKPMLLLRMVRTRARDFYSAKPCPLIKFRSCSLGFRRRNSLRDKKLRDGKSVKDQKAKNSLGANVFRSSSDNGPWTAERIVAVRPLPLGSPARSQRP